MVTLIENKYKDQGSEKMTAVQNLNLKPNSSRLNMVSLDILK